MASTGLSYARGFHLKNALNIPDQDSKQRQTQKAHWTDWTPGPSQAEAAHGILPKLLSLEVPAAQVRSDGLLEFP